MDFVDMVGVVERWGWLTDAEREREWGEGECDAEDRESSDMADGSGCEELRGSIGGVEEGRAAREGD